MKQPFQTNIRARYYETDQMGIVHHSNYIRWFEVGRTDFLRHLGTDYRTVEEHGLLLPVIDLGCSYKQPATYDDIVTIHTSVADYTGVRLRFYYDIYRNETLLVHGYTYHCWTDSALRPVSLTKKWPELHEFIDGVYRGKD